MRWSILVAALAASLALAGCSSEPAPSASRAPGGGMEGGMTDEGTNVTAMTFPVVLKGTAFVNGTLTVRAGDTVHWEHQDGNTPHTVTSDSGAPASFDSSPNCAAGVPVSSVCMLNGSTFDFTFTPPGTYRYHCKVHPSMTGTITVGSAM